MRRSWRIVLPNLEQCALLSVEYTDLDEIAAADAFWSGTPILADLKPEDRKEFIGTILDFFRLEYSNVDRVIKLKEAGFKDDTIVLVIRSDLKEGVAASAPTARSGAGKVSEAVKEKGATPTTQSGTSAASEVVNFETNARVRIERYLVTSGDGLLMNDVEIDAAMVSIVGGKTLKLEFPKNSGGYSGYIFRLAEFKAPFYWDVNKDDTITQGSHKNIYVLKSTKSHAGRPEADGSHYWVISFEPAKPEIAQWIERARIAN